MRDGIVLYISDCYLYYREYVWIELNNCSYLLFVSFWWDVLNMILHEMICETFEWKFRSNVACKLLNSWVTNIYFDEIENDILQQDICSVSR